MATARAAWGIDVGNRALKAVKIVKEADGVRIVDFDVVEHENVLSNAGDNRDALIQNALMQFVQTHNVRGASVAVGVSGQSSFARFIKLPPVEDKQIPNIVRFEAIQQIPFPLDDVEWAYHLFRDEASPDVEVGIFAMRKELVQQHIKFFTDAGLNVEVVQMNPLAVYNAMYHDERVKGTTMIIDLGAENTDLIIAEGETVWLRSIPIGGNNFTEALVKSFKLRFEKAEDLKRNAATSKYGRQILQAMRPIFADLVAEIQRSIGFYASVHRDSRITKVVALGGTFRLPGLQKYLQQNLQLDVQKMDRLGNTPPGDTKVATALSENLLSSVSAYGLALQAAGEAKIQSSLLPQAIRREREWRSKTKWFVAAAACFVAGSALPVARYYYEQAQFERPEASNARETTATQMAKVKATVAKWKEVETAGTAEKTQIATVQSMARYRELWQNVYTDILTSVPPAPAVDSDPAKRVPRQKRRQVVIDEVEPQYMEDLAPALLVDENGILPFLVQQNTGGRVGNSFNPAVERPGVPAPAAAPPGLVPGRSGAFRGIPAPQPPPPPPVATPAAGAGDTKAVRGFLVKIHCMTPYDNGNEHGLDLVTQTLVQSLRNKAKEAQQVASAPADSVAGVATPGPEYRIQKVWVPHYVRLKADTARIEQLRARAQEADSKRRNNPLQGFQVPGAGGGGNLVPGGGRTLPGVAPGIYNPGARYGAVPAMPPGARMLPSGAPVGAGAAANGTPTLDILDPQTGESILDDWDVFVVAAVVLDPAPPATPAAVPGAPITPASTPVAAPAASPGSAPGPVPAPGPALVPDMKPAAPARPGAPGSAVQPVSDGVPPNRPKP